MTGFLHLDNLVVARVPDQGFRQPLPIGHGETKMRKKRRIASAGGISRVEQIMRHLPLFRVLLLSALCRVRRRGFREVFVNRLSPGPFGFFLSPCIRVAVLAGLWRVPR